MNPYLSSIGHGLLVEAVGAQRVAVAQLFALGLRHALQTPIDELPRFWIGGGRVRKIRFPHDVVHADRMPQLDARPLVPEIHADLSLEELARARDAPLRPTVSPIHLVIDPYVHRAYTAYRGLSSLLN